MLLAGCNVRKTEEMALLSRAGWWVVLEEIMEVEVEVEVEVTSESRTFLNLAYCNSRVRASLGVGVGVGRAGQATGQDRTGVG